MARPQGPFPSFLDELTQNNAMFSRNLEDSFRPRKQSAREADEQSPQTQPDRDDRGDQAGAGSSGPRTRRKDAQQAAQRRNKYIPRACQDCQRRKVKCSGENVCHHCRARDVPCIYLPKSEVDGRRKRARAISPLSRGNQGSTVDAGMSETRAKSPRYEENSASIESKIALLQEQVKMFSESARSSDGFDRRRVAFTSSALYTVDLAAENGDETDTFNNGTGSNNLSLSAQLADLHKVLRLSSGLTRRVPQSSGWNRISPLELPHPPRLRYLLDVYFREMDSFFPLLDQKTTEARLFRALQTLGYSNTNLIIDVDTAHYPIVALLCSLLVLGECQDPEIKGCDDSRPGWTMYHRGRKLIQHCGSSRTVDMDLIRYHTLNALYMLDSELLQSASCAISTAVQLAMVARLNDQGLWGDCTPEERQARQRLWWTIYFLDRRIAQRNGTPYIIRNNEIAVDEFEVLRLTEDAAQTKDSLAKSYSENYLQSLIDFGRLWGQIWDNFYAASASKGGDWKEIALADTRILIFRRQLSPELIWDTDKVASYIAEGEEEPMVRRRLAIFIRTNLLRMIIRQNPVLSCDGDEEARLFCAHLAKQSIDAIATFSNSCTRSRTSGYFISTALVECIYHLVYILQDRSLCVDRPTLLDAFRMAYQLLSDFASTWTTSRRALQALSSVIFSGGDANALFEAISKTQSEGGDRLQDTPRNEGQGFGNDWSPGTNFVELLLGSGLDFGNAPASVAAPTLNQLADQILQQESQQPTQPTYTGESVIGNYLPNGFGNAGTGCEQLFPSL